MTISDQNARNRALDPEQSFIVQAPAGSGKTELLIQRYLVLLSRVSAPEEITAITFTRKAAAEMRARVLAALARAEMDTPPQSGHERTTWDLARSALARDRKSGWHLRDNPVRLKIQTIDALCASLTRRMPMLSGFGMQPETTEDASLLYAEAAAETVAELESGTAWSDAVEALIRHLDNHLEKVEYLIAAMLPRRDQWLRHVVESMDDRLQRESLEDALCGVIVSALETTREQLPLPVSAELPALAGFAAENLLETQPGSPVCACLGLEAMPDCIPEDLPVWQGLAELLLTQGGTIRKGADKRLGFPAAPDKNNKNGFSTADLKERKTAFKALLATINDHNKHEKLLEALCKIRQLPAPYYTESQWDLLEALFQILKLAVAHLRLIFQRNNQVDFTEISLSARAAMGDPENPTDLALALDYRMSHILIDEFQDTSISQFELLSLLTAGWTPGDGRTFFAVGDPMQSIYSFREAEVGLFLQSCRHGLGPHLPLTPLVLSANFRSAENIVSWVNSAFVQVLPDIADTAAGAVPYTASEAVLPKAPECGVHVHPIIDGNDRQTAETVIHCIREARNKDPRGDIAILVRSRSHLREIIPMLRAENIRYQAVEIDSLSDRPAISDLIALTRALCHPADRVAWLSVLRAPWCGLTLSDLFILAGDDHLSTVLELMKQPERFPEMSADGQRRISRVLPVLCSAVENLGRRSLSRQVESTWVSLGGPAAILTPADLEDAAVYFDFLEREIGYNAVTDYSALEKKAAALFARPDPEADETLLLMTIHKAKGLEFDTVILPGLEKAPPPDPPRLLLWQELPDADPEEGLLLAPIAETGSGEDPTYQYIRNLHARKTEHEKGRLLYVAATRAKKRLHIIGRAELSQKAEVKSPKRRSLLFSLWPAVNARFLEIPETKTSDPVKDDTHVPCIRRLSTDWKFPDLPKGVTVNTGTPHSGRDTLETDMLRFDWAGETVRHMGTIIHRWLRRICETGINQWDTEQIARAEPVIRSDLKYIGVGKDELDSSTREVVSALEKTLGDPRGQWVLSPRSEDRCEYAVSGESDGQIIQAVMDRTFVDEQNIRWIIDYKSGVHRGGGLQAFLEREKMRYEQQMERYAHLMRRLDPDRRIMLALYFPRFSGWCQWSLEID